MTKTFPHFHFKLYDAFIRIPNGASILGFAEFVLIGQSWHSILFPAHNNQYSD